MNPLGRIGGLLGTHWVSLVGSGNPSPGPRGCSPCCWRPSARAATLPVIVPDQAKSAGTLLVLRADSILQWGLPATSGRLIRSSFFLTARWPPRGRSSLPARAPQEAASARTCDLVKAPKPRIFA